MSKSFCTARRAPRRVFVVALLLGALVSIACGPPPVAAPPPEYPGALAPISALRSPSALGDAFVLEQRVRSESPAGENEFRAVLQLRGDTMTLVGLGPHGGRGFVLTQRGEEVDFESHLPEELPFPPSNMLKDIQRAWFVGLEGPLADGEHREVRGEEEIVERWSDGRLLTRTFRQVDGEPEGTLRVTYEGGLGGDAPPPSVTLDNGWFGYRLILTTLSHQRIEPET